MSSLHETAAALQRQDEDEPVRRIRLVMNAYALADMNIERAQVCTKDQQALATMFRQNAEALRNLANLVGAKP